MLKKLLPVLALAVSLSSCGTSSIKLEPTISLATIPQSLRQPCAPPVALPSGALSSGTTARLWAADRRELGLCGQRQAALSKAVTAIEEQGANPQ